MNWKQIKRVLLAQPPSGLYRRDDRCQNRVEDQTIQVVFPPLDLAYAASALEGIGVECRILDAPAERLSLDEFLRETCEFSPDAVVLSVTQPTYAADRETARVIRAKLPDARIVARGELFSRNPREAMEEAPEFDLALRGESDLTLRDIIQTGEPEAVQGLVIRKGTEIFVTGDRPLLENLDELPFPARHLLKNELYRNPDSGRVMTTIQTQRGCPARCIFCTVGIFAGHLLRKRSPESVLLEVRECVERYEIREFLFHADTFTWAKEWVLELCGLLEKANLGIRWGCNSRVDTIDEERLAAMKKAGCWVIGYGVESGSDETLQRIRKNTSREQALRAVRLTKQVGIRAHTFFVIGFPWETEEDIKETVRFARELDADFFDFNIAYPLPGTDLYEMEMAEGLLAEDKLRGGGYASASVRTRHVSAERLEELRKKALWRMYLRPAYIFRTLRAAGSPAGMMRYANAGIRRGLSLLQGARKERNK